jgi:hypothetical protein
MVEVEDVLRVAGIPAAAIPAVAIALAREIRVVRRFSLLDRSHPVRNRQDHSHRGRSRHVPAMEEEAVRRSGDIVRRTGRTMPSGPTTAAICVATMGAILAIST